MLQLHGCAFTERQERIRFNRTWALVITIFFLQGMLSILGHVFWLLSQYAVGNSVGEDITHVTHCESPTSVGRHERITGLRLQLTYVVAESIMCLGCGGSWPGNDASYTHSSTDSAYYCGMLRSKASLSLLSEPWPTHFCQPAYDDLHS